MTENMWIAAGVVMAFPFVVYLSVKLGTYAFYRGRELFEQTKKEARNGNNSSEGT